MMIIDFVSFAPYFLTIITGGIVDLRALRVLRLLRLLKIARYSQALPAMLGVLYAERRALLGSFILLICAVCAAGEVMHLVEGPGQPKSFGTLPDSMYWAITTLATVGYGDEVPLTHLGKLVAGCTMIMGLVLFAMPIGIIAKGFVEGLHRREFSITWSMVKRQPLFEDFSVEAVGQIVDLMGATMVQDHTRITIAGQAAERFYLIISGRARAEDETGVWELEPGDMIGEEALGDDGVYAKTVLARTEMRLMVLPCEELRRISRKYPLLERRIRNEVAW
jgi:voltage-gated potassium channel